MVSGGVLGAVLGACAGAGVLLAASGILDAPAPTAGRRLASVRRGAAPRAGLACLSAAVAWAVAGWPVLVLGAGVAGWFAPRFFGSGRKGRAVEVARIEALATWTEMLRDGFRAGSLLESTIFATETIAPPAIAGPIERLCAALRVSRPGSTEAALVGFAHELADPTADLIITALLMGARGAAANLAELLSTLATSAREEVSMRLRVETTRAMIRTQRRVILVVIGLFLSYLLLVHRGYLHPYATAAGQVVLAMVLALFGLGIWLLERLARFQPAERTLRPEPQA